MVVWTSTSATGTTVPRPPLSFDFTKGARNPGYDPDAGAFSLRKNCAAMLLGNAGGTMGVALGDPIAVGPSGQAYPNNCTTNAGFNLGGADAISFNLLAVVE